jgi:hypothetical protein
MPGDARDSEAAWRDLVAHYTAADAPAATPAPWPDREGLPEPEPDTPTAPQPAAADAETGTPDTADDDTDPRLGDQIRLGPDPIPGVIPGPPQIRIIRAAAPPPPPPPAEDDEHFIPPAPPPLPKLDPVSKGAWLALFGGPAYLLIAVLVGWQIPSVVAFIAVAGFVGGFTTLVVRMGDRPPTDSGPDDGAVV